MGRMQGALAGVFPLAYTFLTVNALLVVANLPAWVALASVPLPERWWVPLLASVTLAPSLAAAFGAFERLGEGSTTPAADFVRAYRRTFARALACGMVVLAVVGICAADVQFFAGTRWGALLTPVCVVVLGLAVAGGLVALMLLAEGPGAGSGEGAGPDARSTRWPLGPLLLRGGYLAVRCGVWSLVNLALCALALAFVVAQPILGAFLAPSVLLYIAWSNTRYARVRCGERAISVAARSTPTT